MNAAAAIESLAIAQAQRDERRQLAYLAFTVRRVMSRDVRVVVRQATGPGEHVDHTGYIVEARALPEGFFVTICERPRAYDRGEEIARVDLADIRRIERAA